MKASFSALPALAITAMLGTAALSGCSGGGSSTSVPATTAAAQQPTSSNGSVPIGTLDLMHSASTVPVQVTSRTPAQPTVDIRDQATVQVTNSAGSFTVSNAKTHAFAGALRRANSSAKRAVKDVAVNAPYDMAYHGSIVLGSAVSHNIFVNCNTTCRSNENYFPGQFQTDLGQDQFITVLYQYLTSPGTFSVTPITGSFTKGPGADITPTYSSPQSGDSNPYYGQFAIWNAIVAAAGAPGSAPNSLGNGGFGNIYHVFLPKNVDTCMESSPGVSTGECYSPDNFNTFYFCAYHGAFTASNGNGQTTYLYTVQPYQDVDGCRNQVYSNPLPNAYSGGDPADPGYSTLSHEMFETISDPLLDAWFNEFSGGQEMADVCTDFDNYVTVNGHQYVLQSEYSDLHHICVSATLTSPAQTPQQGPYQ